MCLLSCIAIAFGVFLEVKAKIIYLPGEGLAMALSDTFKKEFGRAKIGVDVSMVAVGILSSFIFLHQVQGIREGTIFAAILVGSIVKFFNKTLSSVVEDMKLA
ncbi:putative membrane protein YczE [Methanococcus maripaludis]|uniref:Putative membrane protein YczE n=1 Tax=Methanococcus maripaludis TaxID=39152 RepID=A0A7J9PID2_METMI|nr:putative membrane protein YczE [Methanococcus maripaludis]